MFVLNVELNNYSFYTDFLDDFDSLLSLLLVVQMQVSDAMHHF